MAEKSAKNILLLTLFITFLIKLLLSIVIPLTSDEAYFVLWSKFPDFGYYDHPPMVGWILHLVGFFGHWVPLMRLPAVLTTLLIGAGIYYIVRAYSEKKALLVAVLFLVSPINILNVLITTDTPLIFFSFFSCAFLFLAVNNNSLVLYLLSGICLGGAILSKYFAALLAISFILYFLCSQKSKSKTLRFGILFLAAAPALAVNLYWNYTHCWVNVLFNVLNRNRAEVFSIGKILTFIVSQAYLITPPVVYYMYRHKKEITLEQIRLKRFSFFAVAYAFPIALFALLSLKKMIGLHWALAFYPFLYVVIAEYLSEKDLEKSILFMIYFTLAHLLIVGTLLSLPLNLLKNNKNYNTIIIGTHASELVRELQPFGRDFYFATPSYADSSLLTYHSSHYFSVFGGGSQHGREDDLITDFRSVKGKNILIITGSRPDRKSYEPYFDKIELRKIMVHDAAMSVVIGYGFNYEVYREKVLRPIKETYYRVPSFLPLSKASCYFSNKYFPDENPRQQPVP